MQKIALFLLLLLLLLGACDMDQEADNIKPPIVAPKLVVLSFISPQAQEHRVTVTLSNPIFSDYLEESLGNGGHPVVHNATVVLSDGNREVTLPYDEAQKAYHVKASALPVEAGKTYFLRVSTPDGKQVRSTCTVPAKTNTSINLTALRYQEEPVTPNGLDRRYNIDLDWQDLPGAGDYYRACADAKISYTTTTSAQEYLSRISFGGVEEELIINFANDQNQDGGKFTVKNGEEIVRQDAGQEVRITEIYCTLLTIDEHYYRYHQYIYKASVDLFAEPSSPYTNIQGGLGVFAAYNKYVRAVPVP